MHALGEVVLDYTTAKRSYTSLCYHLQVKHAIENQAFESAKSTSSLSVKRPEQSLIVTCIEKKTQAKMYSRLAAVGRLSFNQIAKFSDFIEEAMRDKKMVAHIHSSPNTIRGKVSEFYDHLITDCIKDFKLLLENP